MNAKILLVIAFAAFGKVHSLDGASRSSTTYSIQDTNNVAGALITSPNYSSESTAGEVGSNLSSSFNYLAKAGFAGQLYETVGFVIDANPTSVAEGGNLQLIAAHLLDDATRLAFQPGDVTWSILDGPLTSITSDGLVTADVVYTNTTANVQGIYGSSNSNLLLTVLNTNPDDFPGYANDGIDDDWQVQYFGLPPNPNAAPGVDADGSGLGNYFKFLAGLNPLDGSRFLISTNKVSGDPSQFQVKFKPLVAGRTYLVEWTTGVTNPDWEPLSGFNYVDEGDQRTVTDFNALPAPKFYRVQISKP